MQQLTEHFTLEEMTRSSTAIRLGLANDPPDEYLPHIRQVAEALEVIRAHFGQPIHVTSCYRSPEVNKAVGGSPTSAHRFGFAADFTVQGIPNKEVCEWVRDNLPEYDQVIYEFGPRGWVHLGLCKREPRRQQLTASKNGGKTVYRNGIIEV